MTNNRVAHEIIDDIHKALGCPPSRAASICDRLEIIRRAVREFSFWLAAVKGSGGQTIATMPREDVAKWVGEQFANEAMGNIRGTLVMAGFSDDDQDDAIDIAAECMNNWRERSNAAGEEFMREQNMWRQVEGVFAKPDA